MTIGPDRASTAPAPNDAMAPVRWVPLRGRRSTTFGWEDAAEGLRRAALPPDIRPPILSHRDGLDPEGSSANARPPVLAKS